MAVVTVHCGDPHDVIAIPAVGTKSLGSGVGADLFPRSRIVISGPVGHRHPRLVVGRRLDAQVAGLFGCEALHLGGHLDVAVGVVGTQSPKDDCGVRRLGRCGDQRFVFRHT